MAILVEEKPKLDEAIQDLVFESLQEKANQVTNSGERKLEPCSKDLSNLGLQSNLPIDDEESKVVDEIESLCMNCSENGITRLLLTRIPFFREIILMSFYCPHCSFKNSEIRSAGEIQQRGSKFELRLAHQSDFARQVVKSDTCLIKFIELDIEVPAGRGQLTNVEGLLSTILEDLEYQQPERKKQVPEVWAKIQAIIDKGRQMLAGDSFPFRVEVNDPAGNSWIEPYQSDGVGKLSKVEFSRTPEQNEFLGLSVDENMPQASIRSDSNPFGIDHDEITPDEVYSFPATCPGCTRNCTTHMKMVDIPHFKQVIIMSTVCEYCGYRSNDIKTGGEVPEKGKIITLKVESPIDLARDILKSESCALECPELELSVNPGTLGGRFTTVEGLLTQVRDDLRHQVFDVFDDTDTGGDSLPSSKAEAWRSFFQKLDEAINGSRKFTVILRDPLAGSYVQNLCLPEKDPQIETEEYERTTDEEDDLGLSDMKTENYMDKDDETKSVEVEASADITGS
ncbi:Zinc finger protein [Podosphaera aphanis]|nr:Zinc finger protein [Podosphaera aphanis]